MLKRLIAATVLGWAPSVSCAQPILLTCTGTLVQFAPQRIEGNVAPTSVTIDLEGKTARVLGGTYEITSIKENELVLSGSSSEMMFFGTVDRTAGTISIMAMRPEERAKLNNGMSGKMSITINLNCTPAKKMF
ncbi:hypothetical protein ACVI1L_000703 [Bradyrhizobium sp. USDA 4516]